MSGSAGIVEFVGLSGAGKSTVAAELVALLRAEGRSVETRTELLGDLRPKWQRHLIRSRTIVEEFIRAPVVFLSLVPRILRSGQRRGIDYPKLVWNFWTVSAVILRHRRKGRGLLVMDQGVFQAIWSVGYMAQTPLAAETWEGWLRRFGLDDVWLVETRLPASIAQDRLLQRTGRNPRLRRTGLLTDAENWKKISDDMAVVIDLARTDIPTEMQIDLVTDGSVSPIDAAAAVVSRLLKA